jgi:hypothetical protein
VTGLVLMATELGGKRVALLREVLPSARRLAILAPRPPRSRDQVDKMQSVAEGLKFETRIFHADNSSQYTEAFRGMRNAGSEALTVSAHIEFARDAKALADLAGRPPLRSIERRRLVTTVVEPDLYGAAALNGKTAIDGRWSVAPAVRPRRYAFEGIADELAEHRGRLRIWRTIARSVAVGEVTFGPRPSPSPQSAQAGTAAARFWPRE